MNDATLIAGRKCRLFGSEKPACVLIQTSARHETPILEEEATKLSALTTVPFLLVTIELEDWILELMPWADRNISRDEEAGKHGQETLDYILQSLIPWLEQRYGSLPMVLGGYSGCLVRPMGIGPDRPLLRHRGGLALGLDQGLDSLCEEECSSGSGRLSKPRWARGTR